MSFCNYRIVAAHRLCLLCRCSPGLVVGVLESLAGSAFSCRRGPGVRDLPRWLVSVGNFVGASFLTGGGGTLFLWPGAFLVDWLQRCSALASWRGGPSCVAPPSPTCCGLADAQKRRSLPVACLACACELTSTLGRLGGITL